MERRIGRLVEIRRWGLITVEEIDRYMNRFGELARAVDHALVVCSDFRGVSALTPQALVRMGEVFRTDKPRVIRSGLLVAPSQHERVERLFEGTCSPFSRKPFDDKDEFVAWLGQVLTPLERMRMLSFVDEARPILSD